MTLLQVVNKLVPLADITKLVGQEGLSQAPRVGLALGTVTEWGHGQSPLQSCCLCCHCASMTLLLHKSSMHVSVYEVTSVL